MTQSKGKHNFEHNLKVSTIDESVGRIIKTLKANGLYKNTLIGEKLKITIIERQTSPSKSFFSVLPRKTRKSSKT